MATRGIRASASAAVQGPSERGWPAVLGRFRRAHPPIAGAAAVAEAPGSQAPRIRGDVQLTITDPATGVAAAFTFAADPTSVVTLESDGRHTELRRTEGRCLDLPAAGPPPDAGELEERITRSVDGAIEHYVATWSVPDPRRPGHRRCVCEVHVDGMPGA